MTLLGNKHTVSPPDMRRQPMARYEEVFTTTDIPPSPGLEPTQTYLDSDGLFPLDLSGVSTVELHILNSRVSRQREREYLTADGPHSETEERFYNLNFELDARQDSIYDRSH